MRDQLYSYTSPDEVSEFSLFLNVKMTKNATFIFEPLRL